MFSLSRMVSKTRKANKGKDVLTVPELRRAFEHIDRFVERKVLRLSEKEGVAAFRKEWKKVFGQISEDSAKDYLQFVRSRSGKASQKGGAVTVLSPASLGYELRAGSLDDPTVPKYIAGGLAPPSDTQMGPPIQFPLPAATVGTNVLQKGGSKRSKRNTRRQKRQNGGALPSFGTALAEFVSRPFGMGAPPSAAQDAQMLAKGYNAFPSPRPEVNDLSFASKGTIFNAAISPTSRMF